MGGRGRRGGGGVEVRGEGGGLELWAEGANNTGGAGNLALREDRRRGRHAHGHLADIAPQCRAAPKRGGGPWGPPIYDEAPTQPPLTPPLPSSQGPPKHPSPLAGDPRALARWRVSHAPRQGAVQVRRHLSSGEPQGAVDHSGRNLGSLGHHALAQGNAGEGRRAEEGGHL